MKNKVVLTFGIWDFSDTTHQGISNALGLAPIKIFVKGELVNPKFQKTAKKNGWMYSQPNREFDPFEGQMNDLIELLRAKDTVLRELASKYYCELSCAVFRVDEEESMPWVHLTKAHVTFLNEFGIEFDLDLYA